MALAAVCDVSACPGMVVCILYSSSVSSTVRTGWMIKYLMLSVRPFEPSNRAQQSCKRPSPGGDLNVGTKGTKGLNVGINANESS